SGGSSSSSSSSSSKKSSGNQLAFLGLAFMVIGGIGVFFGRLIKSAVSRQREFLGDAAAVQFTRNPSSIAGALKKIGGLAAGSRIVNSHAEEASHLFFGNGMGKGFSVKLDDMLATHPPLADRIKRIEPDFDGKLPAVDAGAVSQAQQLAAKEEEETGGLVPGLAPRRAAPAPAPAPPPAAAPRTVDVDPGTIAASVGTLDQAHLELASSFLARLPPALRDAARDPSGACATIFGLLLDRDPALRRRQLDDLQAAVDAPIHEETLKLGPAFDQCPVDARLPLVDLALPALRRLSEPQYRVFRAAVERLIAADA